MTDNVIDALPMRADMAISLDTAHARHGCALSQTKGLFLKRIEDLGDTDLIGRQIELIAAMRTAQAGDNLVLIQELEHLAHDRLTQAQGARQIRRAIHMRRSCGHVREHKCAVIDDLADTQHVINLCMGYRNDIVLLQYYIGQIRRGIILARLLQKPHLCVAAFLGEQARMIAPLYDAARVDHNDLIRIDNRR